MVSVPMSSLAKLRVLFPLGLGLPCAAPSDGRSMTQDLRHGRCSCEFLGKVKSFVPCGVRSTVFCVAPSDRRSMT